MFLRGFGSQVSTHYGTVTHASGALGQVQGDAIRNITGASAGVYSVSGSGSFYRIEIYFADIGMESGGDYLYNMGFDASRVVPTANEDRPVNVAVRYLIRAKN